MDNTRAPESRKGEPHNYAAGGRDRTQPPTDFEGMNYEQKRRPYREASSSQSQNNEGPDSTNSMGQSRDGQ